MWNSCTNVIPTLQHGNSKNEIRQRHRGKRQAKNSEYGRKGGYEIKNLKGLTIALSYLSWKQWENYLGNLTIYL